MVKGLQCVLQVFTIQEVVISLWFGSVSKSPIQDGIFDEIDDFKFSRFYLQSSIKKPHFEKSPRLPFGLLTSNHNHIVNLWSIFFSQSVRSCFVQHQRTGTKNEKEKRGFPFDLRFLIRWCDPNVDTAVVPSESFFYPHVPCIKLSYELCWSDTTGLR